jgi:hypothetical protein
LKEPDRYRSKDSISGSILAHFDNPGKVGDCGDYDQSSSEKVVIILKTATITPQQPFPEEIKLECDAEN